MTTPLPPQEPEKLPGEAELAALYRKLPQAEPGPALDRAVLRAAAEALDEKNAPATATATARRRSRWPVALGSAAALVLAASLGWHMREMPMQMPPAPQGAAADTAASARDAAKATDTADLEASGIAPNAPPPPPAPAMAPPPARPAAREVAAPPIEPAKARRAQARKAMRPAPAPSIVPQMAPAAPPPPPAPSPPTPPVAETADAPMAPTLSALEAPPARFAADAPASELQAIRQLFAQGHDKEGRERLARFQETHPDWPIPDDLRSRLPKPDP